MGTLFSLVTGKKLPMDDECQLINVAAWLWEAQDLIWAEMNHGLVPEEQIPQNPIWRFHALSELSVG